MKERKTFILAFALFLLAILALNFASLYFFGVAFSPVSITGHAINGSVNLYVEGAPKVITIYTPLNTTYNFNIGQPYLLSLNVTADFFNDAWKYSLYDLRHGVYVSNELPFTPNTTFSAVRWGNRLTVYAHETDAEWVSKDLIFYVNVPNSAPLLGAVDDYIYVCEGRTLDYRFNASDFDEDTLYASVSPGNGPFYTAQIGSSGYNISLFKIFSGVLDKGNVGTSLRTISINDKANATCCVDTTIANVTVIEVNNAPVLTGLGVQTVWLQGLNTSFYRQIEVSDVENGYGYEGNLNFTLTFSNNENLFGINSTGAMNYTPPSSTTGLPVTYNLTFCVNDTALSNPHENISLCAVGAGAYQVCDDFTLTITNLNRAPRILNYTPSTINVSYEGTTTIEFSVNTTDDDGTVPDIDWYVDGVLKEHNEGKSFDNYNLLFGCGVRGAHNLSVVVTDGAANTTQFWNLDVLIVACPAGSSIGGGSGGGGGGGGGGALGLTCNEKWVCNDWRICQNAKRSFDAKSLSPEDYYSLRELCAQKSYDERFCGFQITTCFDLAYCNNSVFTLPKPNEMQACYFTENPSCNDGITNCHDDGCELLVDCGGPCSPCPTCSDKIQNQGESGVDCGGPCPYACDYEAPLSSISFMLMTLIAVLVLIGLFILYKVISIIRFSKGLKKKRKERKNS